jgi:hypothetical protein
LPRLSCQSRIESFPVSAGSSRLSNVAATLRAAGQLFHVH